MVGRREAADFQPPKHPILLKPIITKPTPDLWNRTSIQPLLTSQSDPFPFSLFQEIAVREFADHIDGGGWREQTCDYQSKREQRAGL